MLVLALPGDEQLAQGLARRLRCGWSPVAMHRFPDGEALPRIDAPVQGRCVVLAAGLDHPDGKTLPLLFTADAARELGAAQVGLVAPYLPYMRQDKRFKPGEAITSRSYARLLSASLDFLVTVDPHLHRWHELRELYPIRAAAAAAAPAIARWIRANVTDPLLVGPDSESSQWVSQVARLCGAPWAVMQKTRRGDRNVKVVLPQGSWSDHTPVLLDDIVSTGGTLLAAVQALRKAGAAPPVCVAVHALFEDDALWRLIAAGVARVVSCDSVTHPSNAIPLAGVLAQAVRGVAKRANTPKEPSP